MVHLSSIDWVQQVWNGAPRRRPLETYSQVRAWEEKKGVFFCGAAVVEVFYSSSAMKKKERMKESLNHPISLSHVEPGAKTSKYKPVLWFYTLSSCVFGIFHRHGLMWARISPLHSHAKLNIPALAVKKRGWIFYRDWHHKSVWYKSFLQITHIGPVNYSLAISKRDNLGFKKHFFFTAKISHLKWDRNWIRDHALPVMAPVPLTRAYQTHPTFQSGFHAISREYG